MESCTMLLWFVLSLIVFGERTDSRRIKRQTFQDFPDYQDFGLAFVTVHSKPISSERVSTNSFETDSFNGNKNGLFGSPFSHQPPRQKSKKKKKKEESKIPGVAGVDYPTFHTVPPTNFRCSDTPAVPGMYANVETGCQVYHVCHDGRDGPQGASFLCTNGTLFNQKEFICDWWYNVDCGLSLLYYSLNLDPLKNPYTKKEREEELRKFHEFNSFNQQK